ncbi:Hypothetical protein A7982_11558 [Minicystis rosea]|nr:Hypothetical protein A7982_11558 [Minicystis rosea]
MIRGTDRAVGIETSWRDGREAPKNARGRSGPEQSPEVPCSGPHGTTRDGLALDAFHPSHGRV